jgi:peptidoglycan/xylan/chitin deacetylase (PgdA/CDA1 family)
MTLLLTYHRTLPAAPPDNVHVLSRQTFARHMEIIVDSGIPVATPADFVRPTQYGAHRLGLTFDDGFLSDLLCADALARAGMKGIFFISTANIGEHGYLNAEGIRELDAMGMTIGSHSHNHARLTNCRPDEALAQARLSKERLEDLLGKPVSDFAFPGGACNRKLCDTIREAGYERQYTLAWGVNSRMHAASGVFCRSCVVQGMDDDYFRRLISGRNNLSRRMHYLLKGAAAQLLPETAYRHLRQRYLARTGE